MRIKYLLYILLFTLTIAVKPATAQDFSLSNMQNLKVSMATDDQITAMWKKITDAGIPEQEAYKLMAQKGVAPDEIEAFKTRVTLLGLNKKAITRTASTAEKKKIDYSRDNDSTVIKPPVKAVSAIASLPIYGADFFNNPNKTFDPSFNIATPKGYVLGPGDNIIVLLTGLNESSVVTKVTPEGNLQVPYAGLVYVNGFTIEQATSLIKAKMSKVYPALKSGKSQLTVNLGNTRSIKIIVTGEVKAPGSYTLSSLSTLYFALYLSDGPNKNGSLRYISIIRNNKVYKVIDFYNFLQKGIIGSNVRLEDQDVIRIPVYKKRVSISGEVKNPAIYELKDDEKLEDLIEYAGGFTDKAYRGIAKVDQINALQREVKDVPANLFSNYTPHDGDKIEIGAITDRYTNRIVLQGSVYRPDVYELTAGFSLAQLLKSAEGLKPEAYTTLGYIKRTLPNLEKTQISFVPADIVAGKNDVPLLREDTVVILDKSIFMSNLHISIQGYVRQPAVIPYRKGIKLDDVIAMAGGFAEEAADHRVEITRIIKNESDSVANQLSSTFIVNMDNKADPHRDDELQPMDVINVPRLPNYHGLGSVVIKGEVVFPSDYPVLKRDETALEFLQRAGGVTPYGSLENTQVYRKGVRVNLDLKNAGTDNINKSKMILLPGDSVYVPRVISYVEVSGAVNNPQYINYKSGRFKYYINAAAGVKENARLKGAYIKYPNGLNKPVRHFLFFRSYPTVKPGSTIVVPEKAPNEGLHVGFGDLGGISAALTALVGIVAILIKK
ncbi:MAG: SLBB domain-containing protein [Mucilaginibacter sp.]